jgi:hypothetical protein
VPSIAPDPSSRKEIFSCYAITVFRIIALKDGGNLVSSFRRNPLSASRLNIQFRIAFSTALLFYRTKHFHVSTKNWAPNPLPISPALSKLPASTTDKPLEEFS